MRVSVAILVGWGWGGEVPEVYNDAIGLSGDRADMAEILFGGYWADS